MKNIADTNNNHKTFKIEISLVILFSCILIGVLISENTTYNKKIDIVYNGTSFSYPNEELTYGNVFSEYFDNNLWYTETINENQFVVFSGDVQEEDTNKTETIEIWFLISDDNYVIRNFTIDGCQGSMDVSYNILNNAFISYMEKHGIDCVEIYPEYIN